MKRIQNPELLQTYMERCRIPSLFSSPLPKFELVSYDTGEILSYLRDSTSLLQFLVEGSVQIYALRADGSRYLLCQTGEFSVLGDLEFCGENPLFFVETASPVLCLELSLQSCREQLLSDSTFLLFLLRSVAHKLALVSRAEASCTTLEEKLLHYLKYETENHSFQGVELLSQHLHCSRRQLQRLLKKLTDEHVLEKTKKGGYRLV